MEKSTANKNSTSSFADGIHIVGAREHNLKNVSLFIPRNKVTVFTGLSGSGKSSLAFDTIYAEGQRRYVESLSAYARNFLDQLKKPNVDSIVGLSPAISIEQKTTSSNPRSTVGTVTEIYDLLRLLYSKVGEPYCPNHKTKVSSQGPSSIVNEVLSMPRGSKVTVYAPVVRSKKGEFLVEFKKWLKKGYVRARVDGQLIELETATKLAKNKVHSIELVIDRLVIKDEIRNRLSEAINSAIKLSDGFVVIEDFVKKSERSFSIKSVCPECQFSFPDIEPRLFSFNNPKGYCPDCQGLGTLSLFPGMISDSKSKNEEGSDDNSDEEVDELAIVKCERCQGKRLRLEALNIFIQKKNIASVSEIQLSELKAFLNYVSWPTREKVVVEKVLKELFYRIEFLLELGLGYLTLSRPMRTLSGGESQRIRLASQLGSGLVGVLYVLDEPSIGLHPRDHHRLLNSIHKLRDLGNTIVLVEHDEDTIMSSDYVIDVGPGAGKLGGNILATGTPSQISENLDSITGSYLSKRKNVFEKNRSLRVSNRFLELKRATGNNLKSVNIEIPVGVLCCVTGVSGSGKSTLILDTLFRAMAQKLYKTNVKAAPFESLKGSEYFDSVINIDQKPIGRTPRSNPSTYVGLFSMIRDLFSNLPESRLRGYKPGRFSFNVKGGRCDSCDGAGSSKIEMHFLADVFVLCDVCQGARYNRETLSLKYKTKSIADILAMTVEEAFSFFEHHKQIHKKLETLMQVGLGYIQLGQSSTTLSGGEAQRIKLSKELSKRGTGKTLYILDEPTTGLHFEDIKKLIELLDLLVASGNTVVVIEHNVDLIKSADYIVDLGPEGGNGGGKIVAFGTPAEIRKSPDSITGRYI